MFKSSLTRTLYQDFISHYLTEKFTQINPQEKTPAFVYVDQDQIKYMGGLSEDFEGQLSMMQFSADKNNPLEIRVFEGD